VTVHARWHGSGQGKESGKERLKGCQRWGGHDCGEGQRLEEGMEIHRHRGGDAERMEWARSWRLKTRVQRNGLQHTPN